MLASRKVERPSKKELKNLLLEFNMSQIAQIYNVTDNAIRRWCDLYRLPKRLNGIKQLREKEKKKREEKEKLALEKQRQKEAVQFKKQLDKLL